MSLVRAAGQSEAGLASMRIGCAPPRPEAADYQAVAAVRRSGWLTTGPGGREFEAAVAAYTGARYAVAVNAGTAALHLSLPAAVAGPRVRS